MKCLHRLEIYSESKASTIGRADKFLVYIFADLLKALDQVDYKTIAEQLKCSSDTCESRH